VVLGAGGLLAMGALSTSGTPEGLRGGAEPGSTGQVDTNGGR
jgi:hypothetical protein